MLYATMTCAMCIGALSCNPPHTAPRDQSPPWFRVSEVSGHRDSWEERKGGERKVTTGHRNQRNRRLTKRPSSLVSALKVRNVIENQLGARVSAYVGTQE